MTTLDGRYQGWGNLASRVGLEYDPRAAHWKCQWGRTTFNKRPLTGVVRGWGNLAPRVGLEPTT
jgi:hypothetical protein